MAAIMTTKQCEGVSWGHVAELIQSGKGIEVGTVITDALKDGREFSVVAVHNNPYHKNEVAFRFVKAPFRCQMYDGNTNEGGWKGSNAREELKKFFELLPDDLQAVIKKKKIVQMLDGKRVKCKDKLWLPTEYEMFGECYYSEQTEADTVQFDYFKDRKNRMTAVEGEDDYAWNWLASPYASSTTYFCLVTGYGDADYSSASNSHGVAPGFLIR